MNRLESVFRHPQRLAAAGVLLFALLAAGCQKPTSETTPKSPAVADVPGAEATSSKDAEKMDLQAAIKNDMAYADVRKLLLDGGWEPVRRQPRRQRTRGKEVRS